MDREIFQTLKPLFGKENILRAHQLLGSTPVSFAKLRQQVIHEIIEEGIRNGMTDAEIARIAGVCTRTVERHKRSLLFRFRKDNLE